jgi:hypothetical protein
MSLLISEQPLLIMPKLAVKIGLNEAILTQQIHYWLQKSDKVRDGKKWIYNTHDSWLEQFPFWSKPTLKRVIASLKKQGIITTGNYNNIKMDRTIWYTINYSHPICSGVADAYQDSPKQLETHTDQPLDQYDLTIGSDCTQQEINMTPSHKLNMTSPIPETTETTTEITTDIKEDINFGFLTSDEFNELTEIRIANYKAAKKKAPVMSQRIANTLINQIRLAIDRGFPGDDVLSKFATRGWLSFECEWMAAKDSNSGSKTNTISINGSFTPQQEKRQRVTNTILNPPEW